MLTANHRHREEAGGRQHRSGSGKPPVTAASATFMHAVKRYVILSVLGSTVSPEKGMQSKAMKKNIYIVIQLGSLFSSAGALHFKVRPHNVVLCVETERVTRGRRKNDSAKYSFKCFELSGWILWRFFHITTYVLYMLSHIRIQKEN